MSARPLRCPACLAESPRLRGPCPRCGEALTPPCPGCGATRARGARRCAGCGEGWAEAAPDRDGPVSPAAVRDLEAFLHPRDRRAFSGLLEAPGLGRLHTAVAGLDPPPPPLGQRPATGPVLPAAMERAGLAPFLGLTAAGGARLGGGQLLVGKPLAAAVAPGELEFLALSALYPRLVGLEPLLALQAVPTGPGELAHSAALALRAWLPTLALSGDRFALSLTREGLPTAARALFKQAALGGKAGPREVLARLDAFRPGETFEAYRRLLEGCGDQLERVWELFGFARSPRLPDLRRLDPATVLFGCREEPSASPEQADAGRGGTAPSAAPAPPPSLPAPPLATAAAPPGVPRPPALRHLRLVGRAAPPPTGAAPLAPGAPPGPGDAVYYLSAYHRAVRVRTGVAERSLDLSEHLRLPARLAVGPSGDLWVADGETGRAVHLDAGGAPLAVLEGLPRRLGAMRVDAAGRLLVADRARRRVRVLGPDGRELRELGALAEGLRDLTGLALEGESGALWMADPVTARLVRLDPEGAVLLDLDLRATRSGVDQPVDLAADGAGGVWVVDGAGGKLVRFGPGGYRRQVLVPPGEAGPLARGRVRRTGDGRLLLLDSDRGRILQWSPELRFAGCLEGLAAAEDAHGYCADLELGPGLSVPSSESLGTAETEPTRGLACVRSI